MSTFLQSELGIDINKINDELNNVINNCNK